MRAAMRQDPDVILIGEMRDSDTVAAALAAGETGHLVLSTLHTTNAVETVNRVVDFFPPDQQHQVRISLASALLGIICQRLVPKAGGSDPRPRGDGEQRAGGGPNHRSEAHVGDPPDHRGGRVLRHDDFDQCLLTLVQSGSITVEDAVHSASNAHDFGLKLEQAGIRIPA